MKITRPLTLGLALLLGLAAARAAEPRPALKTENVILFMTDGLRWQEVFSGADEALLNKEKGGVPDVEALKGAFWRDTPEGRREVLLPFVWTVMAVQGQIYGNANKGSVVRLANGLNFSYPSYSEILCGFVDPQIDSNDKRLNPNLNVLEWLNKTPRFGRRVAAFCGWDVFPYILNRERAGFLVNAGFEPLTEGKISPQVEMLNRLTAETAPVGDSLRPDPFTFNAALEYLRLNQPRVLYVALGETDEWGHEVRYDRYLQAAHRADGYVRLLWETVQALPQYQGKTTLIFTTDHGRGDTPADWKGHGKKLPASERTWVAFLGPDTPALGERTQTETVTQSQIAATLAALLGEDYVAAVPKAGQPIADVLGVRRP